MSQCIVEILHDFEFGAVDRDFVPIDSLDAPCVGEGFVFGFLGEGYVLEFAVDFRSEIFCWREGENADAVDVEVKTGIRKCGRGYGGLCELEGNLAMRLVCYHIGFCNESH